jgi:hypothetical protein
LLLALLDEVEQAIATLKEEMADARRELNAAHRGRIAGTAYRQGGRL